MRAACQPLGAVSSETRDLALFRRWASLPRGDDRGACDVADSGDAWRPDGPRWGLRDGRIAYRRPLTSAQKAALTLGSVVWIGLCLATVTYVTRLSNHRLDLARGGTAMASLWFQPQGWITAAFVVPMVAGLLTLLLPIRWFARIVALPLILAAMIGASATASRAYVMVADDHVLIHPALPWHHDVRFALADATVTARGCRLSHDKHGMHHHVIFRVQGPGGRAVDLGDAAPRDIRTWLAVMRDYDDGGLPFPAQAGAGAPHDPDCIAYWRDGLDPRQGAELDRLLG